MAIDYYAETQQIIEALSGEGMRAEADAIRNVMDGGSTATEILMGISLASSAERRGEQTSEHWDQA
jgi:hypothetical protein